MQKTFQYPEFAYRRSDEQLGGRARRHPVVVVGAGPVGLSAALDLASRGVRTVVLDDNNTVSVGSRAVCYAKRPLEIWDRLGCGERLVGQGVSWKVGKVYFRDEPVYAFDLLPESGHKMPAMINLQQYHLEQCLVDACERNPLIELRWKHKVTGLEQAADHVALQVQTPDGPFGMQAQWVVACDGANSELRSMVGAEFTGQVFHDRFLIADVVMKVDFPPERWFWFDPPFHRGQSVLLHKECDNVWRIDFQLGPQADPVEAKKPKNVVPRIRAMLGPKVEFDLEWVSIYQFACRRIDRFRHGRVLFAGDSAHQVSPFGARGANSGVQDTDNLAWKLALVIEGRAPETLLDSYHDERALAADDNILHSTRATDFISPKNNASLLFRNATLELARDQPFARALVNSGRLSTPTPYLDSPLNTADTSGFEGAMRPGTNCADAPVERAGRPGWFLEGLGDGFTVLVFGPPPETFGAPSDGSDGESSLEVAGVRPQLLSVGRDLGDRESLLAHRYDGRPGTTYLIRPDHYVAARWREFDAARIRAALARCLAIDAPPTRKAASPMPAATARSAAEEPAAPGRPVSADAPAGR